MMLKFLIKEDLNLKSDSKDIITFIANVDDMAHKNKLEREVKLECTHCNKNEDSYVLVNRTRVYEIYAVCCPEFEKEISTHLLSLKLLEKGTF